MFNCFECLGKEKTIIFLGGIATAIVGSKILKCPKTRQICVRTLAHGMNLCDETKATMQNMREEAEDIYADAKNPTCEKQYEV